MMMPIPSTLIQFSKMHGLGNDFVVIDLTKQSLDLKKLPITQLAHRHLGIGFDQLLLIETSQIADFTCRIFNADGSEAEQCGNGLRCVARYIVESHLCQKKSFIIATKAGVFPVIVHDNTAITVTMGFPGFEPEAIPFIANEMHKIHELILDQKQAALSITVLTMGNPHTIIQITSLRDYPVVSLGTKIATHSAFPKGTNVGLMEIISRQHIKLRTVERGAGETFACGSNACAAVVAGIKNGLLDRRVRVELALGSLWVEWPNADQAVTMTGPAERVFEGSFNLDSNHTT